jgi:hypothetical protein
MSLWSSYILAGSIPEALDAWRTLPRPARAGGGGHGSAAEKLQQRPANPPSTPCRRHGHPELNCLEIRDGAAIHRRGRALSASHAVSPLVKQHPWPSPRPAI